MASAPERYYEKMIQWATHFKLKLEHLHGVLKQFIKITEYGRDGKLQTSMISKAELQEVITELHTKLEDYKFSIPTSHIRAECYFRKLTKQTSKLHL